MHWFCICYFREQIGLESMIWCSLDVHALVNFFACRRIPPPALDLTCLRVWAVRLRFRGMYLSLLFINFLIINYYRTVIIFLSMCHYWISTVLIDDKWLANCKYWFKCPKFLVIKKSFVNIIIWYYLHQFFFKI